MSMASERDTSTIRYDWSARVRTTTMEALRYSRFVVLMKRVLALGAFLTIAAVLAFFFMQRMPRQMSYEYLGKIKNDLTMVKPRLAGSDSKGRPYVITAERAVQDAHNPKKAVLENLEADLSLERGNWINARARSGMADTATGHLELYGGIAVFTATGYELHSNSASANLSKA